MKFSPLFILLFTSPVWANKVATVKLLRGQVEAVVGGKVQPLKAEAWVEEGALIKTSDKSFVKLVFVDKSSMNVGPNSEMKIEKFNGKEAGVIDVVKGQIRSQVTKDYLQMKDQDKSKLFMKTGNAVMGVRGTDFMITTNGINTSTVLFEGSVVFNSLPEQSGGYSNDRLESIVDQGVRVQPGEFSVVQADLPQPTVPSTLNLQQRDAVEKNSDFEQTSRGPASAVNVPVKTVVPEGLSGTAVSNSTDAIKQEVAGTGEGRAPASTAASANAAAATDAAGYVDGDKVKPANGSFVHLASGTIIPPPAGSVLDPNTNSFLPAPGNGAVAEDGSFVPPKGVEITNDGKILITIESPANGDAKGDGSTAAPKVIEVAKMAPVVSASGDSTTLEDVVKTVNSSDFQIADAGSSAGPIPLTKLATTTVVSTTTTETPIAERIVPPSDNPVLPSSNVNASGTLNIDVIK